MNRRTFLAAATAAVAKPADRIRVGMLGTTHSHAGGKLKVLLESPDYEVAGVCEPNPDIRRERQSQKLYAGLQWMDEDALLGDTSIRVIAVEGQVADFPRLGRKVIDAGRHLHLEKPPGDAMAPFRALVDEARRKRLLLQTGYIWRFHAGLRAAINAARRGDLGDLFQVRGTIHTDLESAGRTPLARFRGGMMFELGCHMIDRVVDLMGRPEKVTPFLRHDTRFQDELADNVLTVFEYQRAMAVVSSAARQPGHSAHRSFEILGTDGTITIQPVEPGTRMRVTMRAARGPYRAGMQEIDLPPQVRYAGDFQDLARALNTGTELTFSYDHELLVQETLLRACGERV